MRRQNELVDALKKLGISEDDYCIVGGATLAKLGIRENNDIDLVIKKEIRTMLGFPNGVVNIGDGVEIVTEGWASIIGISDDEIIGNNTFSEKIGGHRHSKLELLFCLNLYRDRKKDERDNTLILSKISGELNWDWDIVRRVLFEQNGSPRPLPIRELRLLPGIIQNAKIAASRAIRRFSGKGLDGKTAPSVIFGREGKIPMKYIIGYQYESGEFTRDDIFFRKIVADEIIQDSDSEILEDYTRMQEIRIREDTIGKFRELIDSFERNGFSEEMPLELNYHGRLGLGTGAHRVAASMAMGIDEIPIKFSRTKERYSYKIDWFEDNEFSSDLIQKILKEKESFFSTRGLITPVIIWPPASHLVEEIGEKLESLCRIIGLSKLTFDGFSDFEEFTKSIYSVDDVDDWKVLFKLSRFSKFKPEIYIFTCDLNPHEYRAKGSTNSPICSKVEKVKRTLRDKFRGSIDDYTYDVICHIGDNFEHNAEISKIISKYGDF